MVVNIWYDVSDVADGGEPHLAGTRRITVDSLGGLTALGVRCRLVRFDRQRQAFVAVASSDLPETIRRHLPRLTAERPVEPDDHPLAAGGPRGRPAAAAAEQPPSDPATQRLWQSSREFRRAARDLGRDAVRWVKSRLRPRPPAAAGPVATAPVSPGVTRPLPLRSGGGDDGLFAAGDVLLSLGETWEDRGHADAVAEVRRRGVRVLRMIHDLMPTLESQWVSAGHAGRITIWARRLLTDSDHVFTISEFTSREIVRYCEECGFPRPGMSVVRPGDVLEAAAAEPPPLPRFVPERPFFACVSTIDARSNHRLLHETWRQLAARDPADCPDLVCVGSPRPGVADLLHELTADRLVNGRIHLLDGVDDHELAWYYRHCLATIYPSRYDGWALAVAESLGQGKIPLASNATSIPEISAELPEFFEPHDVRRLVELVDRVRHDAAWREGREDLIRRTFRPTAWTDTAARLIDVVRAMGSRRNIAA